MTYLEQLDSVVAERLQQLKVSEATSDLIAAIQQKLPGNIRLEGNGIGSQTYRLSKNASAHRDGVTRVVRESVIVDLLKLADEVGVEVPEILR
jgi:hypothetical protein